MSATVEALIQAERLPARYAEIVEQWWKPLAARLRERHAALGRPMVVGINGAQGSGKSTLCAFLEEVLLPELGLFAVTLSLDDFYLDRTRRAHLAATEHPLFATRGVPGTHDMALLGDVLAALIAREPGTVHIPRFSKADDDVLPRDRWRTVPAPADIILLEGWCIGVTPQNDADLREPVNELERIEDPDGVWRYAVNRQLAGAYRALFDQLDYLIFFEIGEFAEVFANRLLQEQKLRGPDVDQAALRRFVMHYERLTRHALKTLPTLADARIMLGPAQAIGDVIYAGAKREKAR